MVPADFAAIVNQHRRWTLGREADGIAGRHPGLHLVTAKSLLGPFRSPYFKLENSVNKGQFLAASRCTTMAWHQNRRTEARPSEAARFRMEQGREVAMYVTELLPDGVFPGGSPAQVVTQTHDLIEAGTPTIFEAAFRSEPFVAKADILQRNGDGWDVIEVKSSFPTSPKVTTDYIDDLAYTVMVLRRVGINVKRSQLLLLSKDYRCGDPIRQLFCRVDKTPNVSVRAAEFEQEAERIASAAHSETTPPPALKDACRTCDFFTSDCIGSGIDHTVLELPKLHKTKFRTLRTEGVVDIADVPADFTLTPMQQRVKTAAESGRLFVGPGLSDELAKLEWPCRYLDFETVATVLPLYDGLPCHHQLLTQFSVHGRRHHDSELDHDEFLADPARDDERELARHLLDVLGKRGSIVVYSHFENQRLKGLSRRFPDLGDPLNAIRGRLVDFATIVRKHVYHPAFQGSFSLKKVVPALVPDISYEDLAISDGEEAVTMFARMARGEIADVEKTRRDLLAYCETDTLVMVRLHETLARLEAS